MDTFDVNLARWFGAVATLTYDPAQDNTGNGGGACRVSGDFTTNQSLIFVGAYGPGGIWESNTLLNLSTFLTLEFDVRWDNRSSMSLADFNHPPAGGYAPMSVTSLKPLWLGRSPVLGTFAIPDAATSGWVRVTLPINPATADIDPSMGLWFEKWLQSGNGTASFWLDNVRLTRLCGDCIPYPRLALQRAVPGLNLFAGGTAPYGRENIRTAAGLGSFSWLGVGQMSYAFTVRQFDSASTNLQLHLLLVPNAGASTAPDWAEPDVVKALLLPRADGSALWQAQIKTNGVPTCPGACPWPVHAEITNSTLLGTWSLNFSSDTNLSLSAPDGGQVAVVLPADVAARFTDPLTVYLGVMAGDTASLGGSVVLAEVRLAANGSTMLYDDFSRGLNTNLWEVIAADPQSVQPVPDIAWWLHWTTPATGFVLATNANPANPAGWSTNELPAPVQIGYLKHTLLTANPWFTPKPLPLPGARSLFFRLQRD